MWSPYIEQNPWFQGPFLADLTANLGTVRGNFGMNGKDATVLMSSKALEYIIIDLERKWIGSASIQSLVCCVT